MAESKNVVTSLGNSSAGVIKPKYSNVRRAQTAWNGHFSVQVN